jgi:hypothetical protein
MMRPFTSARDSITATEHFEQVQVIDPKRPELPRAQSGVRVEVDRGAVAVVVSLRKRGDLINVEEMHLLVVRLGGELDADAASAR